MEQRDAGQPAQPEREPQQRALLELIELQEAFGFVETPELTRLHGDILAAAAADDTDARRRLTGEYQDRVVAILGDDPIDDLRHGFALAQAAIKLEAGYDFASLDDMQDVLEAMRYVSKYAGQAAKLDAIMQKVEFPNGPPQ